MGNTHAVGTRRLYASSSCHKAVPPKPPLPPRICGHLRRTRPAAQPLPGIPTPKEPQDRMYTASFIRGPSTPEAFSVDTMLTPAAPPGEMEIDGEQPQNDKGAPLPNQ